MLICLKAYINLIRNRKKTHILFRLPLKELYPHRLVKQSRLLVV